MPAVRDAGDQLVVLQLYFHHFVELRWMRYSPDGATMLTFIFSEKRSSLLWPVQRRWEDARLRRGVGVMCRPSGSHALHGVQSGLDERCRHHRLRPLLSRPPFSLCDRRLDWLSWMRAQPTCRQPTVTMKALDSDKSRQRMT